MQFLDAIGLAYFWEKIKSWVGKNYLSLKGGTVHGDVEIDNGGLTVTTEEGINLKELDTSPRNVSLRFIDGLVFSQAEGDGTDYSEKAHYDSSEAKTGKFVKNGGTATQVLMADGSVKELSQANGIPVLDAGGNIPLSQLGNLDTTVAEVVAELPTSNIKRHIYLVKDSDTANNKYAEYVYTGDISAAYDSTKWEKLGDFRATVDLKDYSKKSETISGVNWDNRGGSLVLAISLANGNTTSEFMPIASSSTDGAMSNSDKVKLDKFDISSISDNIDVSMLITAEFNDVEINSSDNSISVGLATLGGSSRLDFSLPAATSKKAGVMSAADKTKLDGISSGATADSAIPTSVIDALN